MEKLVKEEENKKLFLASKKKKKKEEEEKRDFSQKFDRKKKKQSSEKTSDNTKAERLKLAKIDDPTKNNMDEDEVKPLERKDDESSNREGNTDFFGTKALENTQLKTDGIKSGESNKEKSSRYSKMMKRSNRQLMAIRQREKSQLSKTLAECDSEDKLEKTLDYQKLISSISQQQICRQIQKDISYNVGNEYMEKAYQVSENKRKVEREIAKLHHVEFTIKRRYQEVSPDTGTTFKEKLKTKAFINTTYQFREHTGGYVDRET